MQIVPSLAAPKNRLPIWIKLVPFLLAALTGCVHYTPKPLAPEQTASRLESRTLSDAGLQAFIETNAPDAAKEWPRRSWDFPTLTLAAFYYHPSLDVARAQVWLSEAAVITAGGRPNPTVGVTPGYTDSPESPWLYGIRFDIPIETAGKRGLRIAQARRLSEAARLQLAEAGWDVRSRVRAALLEHLLTGREVDALAGEIIVRSNVVHLIERRLAVGEVSRTEVDLARIELVRARVSLREAEGRLTATLVELATALGVPPSALGEAKLDWPQLNQPPARESLPPEKLQRAGLLNRLDMRRALVEYAAAEAAFQLEVAKQYPDIHLGPGYSFEEGANQYKLGLTLTLPVLNQNQGPIAEAKARREKSAAQFLALQAQVIGELHMARAQYAAALAELKEVETSLTELQDRTERLTQRAVEVGEADRLALASVQLLRFVVARGRLDALRRAQTALGALEDAVQRPLAPASPLPEVPLTTVREAKETK